MMNLTRAETICVPPCQNNGICMAPNQCNCPENFMGPQCQFENKPCLNYPPMPINSRRSCRSNICTISCLNGHEFPDGSAITTMACKNGLWVPTKEKWQPVILLVKMVETVCHSTFVNAHRSFEDLNANTMLTSAVPKKLPVNGGYKCSGDGESVSCSISCPEGIQFEFQPEPFYTCHFSTGIFLPAHIPQCVYPDTMEIIPQPGSSYNYFLPNTSGFSLGSPSIGHGIPVNYEDIGNPIFIPNNMYAQTPPPTVYNDSNVVQFVPIGQHGKQEHQFVTLEPKLPSPGSCFHWGSTHYKTFDGKIYSFESKCSHILVRDGVDNTFSIVTKNHEDCYFDPVHCHTVVMIYLQDKEYYLKRSSEGVPIFASTKKTLPIPGQLPGIRVEMSAHHIVVSLDSLGVKIRWDGQQFVHVEAKENLWNRTEGLCGKLDGDVRNDALTRDGQVPRSIVTLASSWKADDPENFVQASSPSFEN
ncbi:hypothetical protein NQ318_019042 [Aromia moschata]|uniref:von Willebrand factor D and EGF domain-containing protein n=1 Tax=Aromia moschata TaxID=1265417 RepID=A0AAV8Y0S0_9CUCU|nr:hypothetical protein NQ318_019042 [Aromia moschata]